MSNIYIQEPSTSGKVVLSTTAGDIDIELWTRECPLACRNFIQLCLEGYYNGTIFHRVVKNFIVQGGDPCGDGTGGVSIYGEAFKDEFHSRLRYTRRGLVGMANSGKDDNGSQFFFTMGATPELQNKNTLFGKVTGNTIYNMLKLQDGLVNQNERPMYPPKILRTEILSNPFDDIKPRSKMVEEKKEKCKTSERGVKNFGLLSFGIEAEEDEEQTNEFVQKHARKSKSFHDASLSVDLQKDVVNEKPTDSEFEKYVSNMDRNERDVQNKLRHKKPQNTNLKEVQSENDSDADEVLLSYEEEIKNNKEKLKLKLRQDIIALKREYHLKRQKINERPEDMDSLGRKSGLKEKAEENFLINNYLEEKEKYKELHTKIPLKGSSREAYTLRILSEFRMKLNSIKQKEISAIELNDHDVDREIQSDEWMVHKLECQKKQNVLAKDASTKSDDWYDVYDPRNPINKRKRNSKSQSEEKRKR